jgi:peptide/nickel transport system substrate-binding protein
MTFPGLALRDLRRRAVKQSIRLSLALASLVLLAACAPSAPLGRDASAPQSPATKKRIVGAVLVEPQGWLQNLTQRSSTKGLPETQQLMNSALTYLDDEDVLQPHLAETVPTVENGLWKVLPDGRMETSWRLKPGLVWQDGAPFTSDDLVFSAQVNRDKQLEIVVPATFELVESVEAPDPRTVLVRWRETFIEADTMFSPSLAMPMARHILEQAYTQDKDHFITHPYWREDFVGTGPYRLAEWVAGSHILLRANDLYVFGRPKIDEIEVKFIPDYSIITANLMAGTVEKLMGISLSAEQGTALRDTAPNLNVVLAERLGGVVPMWMQFLGTDPPILLNLEFRRALYRAIDRKEMNETINYGIGPIADTWLQPDKAEYRAIESQIVRYEYDPRRAEQAIASLGYTRGSDGTLVDPTGQRLHIEIRTNDREVVHVPSALAVVEYWKRLGVDAEMYSVPLQRTNDAAYRSTFPAFDIAFSSPSLDSASMRRWRSSVTPLPENNYEGQNRIRYQNPAFDALIDRYVSTIPWSQRMVALGEFVHHQTDQLLFQTFFYNATASVLGSKRLKNVTSSKMWNAHVWDVEG